MMERVADNEEHPPPESTPADIEPRTPPTGHPPPGDDRDEPRTPSSGQSAPGGELSVRPPSEPTPATPPPPAIDPEAVRQFQQFQQFQELMRQQQEQGFPQGTPPAPGALQPWGQPPKRPPFWKRILRTVAGKLATLALIALLLVFAYYWLVDKLPGSGPPEQAPAHEIGGGKAKTNLIFETDPRNAVQKIYNDVAQGNTTGACGRFTDEARAEFTDHFSELGTSCEEIVGELSAQVRPGMKGEYESPHFPSWVNTNPTSDTVPVSSCALEVTGGPRLGLLTVSKIQNSVGGQWIVTRHDDEPADCSGVASTPPTT